MLSQGMAGTTKTQRGPEQSGDRHRNSSFNFVVCPRIIFDCSGPFVSSVSLWLLTYVRRNINEGLVEIDVGDRWIGDSLEWLYVRRPRGGTRPATHIRQEGWRVFQECYNQHTERSQRR